MPYYPEKKPVTPGEETKQNTGMTEKRRKLLRLLLAVFFCFLIGYGAVRLIPYISDLNASRQSNRELRDIREQAESASESPAQEPAETISPSFAPAGTPVQDMNTLMPGSETETGVLQPMTYPDNPGLRMSDRFRQLRKKSKYIVGWISFDEVDEAVAQKDNTFFLDHDAAGRKNSNGAIFLDSGIFLTERPYTLFLYGHNMKSGNMFGKLKKYKESSYFYENRIIAFDSLYEDGQYAVFAVLEISTVPGTARWYNLWSLNTASRADREEAIRTLERRSVVSSTLDVQADDQLLLLVTCLDGDTERLVVAARRLRNNETADSLVNRKNP